ncbi:EML6 [Symbiodinium microadriaticum]|nr:EML6 [Symbiodinium microadriaticum]
MLVHANVGRIRRVASHPLLDVFATIATDKTVRLWSTLSSSQVALTRVASCGTAITFTPDGSAVAVGTDVGEVLILTCTYLQSCLENNAEPALPRRKARWELLGRKFVGSKSGSKGNEKGGARRSAKFEITELKYSPTGDCLAVAGRDKSIHFLSAVVRVHVNLPIFSINSTFTLQHGYKKVGTCKGHSGVITRVDFSDDGTLLQSCDGARETLYWEVPSGKQISDSRVKGTTWFTWSNPMGKPVKGIMNTCDTADSNNHITDLVSINAVHRSNDMKSLLVGGGGNGFTPTNLKLFRFPCTSSAVPKEYSGHASSISDACFLQSDENVVSIGSSDACVLCWKHVAT